MGFAKFSNAVENAPRLPQHDWFCFRSAEKRGDNYPDTGGFRTFLNNVMLVPAQIMKGARRITFRLLSYNKWVRLLLEGSLRLRRMST